MSSEGEGAEVKWWFLKGRGAEVKMGLEKWVNKGVLRYKGVQS